jgi:hypothetical protein
LLPELSSSQDLIEVAHPVVKRVVRKRFFGVSLSSRDDSYENQRALDCVQQAMLELVVKFARVEAGDDPPIQSLKDYAARVAHNAVNDVVRPPNWTRLKHRLFRVLSRHSQFASWVDPQLGKVCGYAGWRTRKHVTAHATIAGLRQAAGELRADAVLATHWDNMGSTHWQTLLERVFDIAGGPIEATTLINFLAELLDIRSEVPLSDPDADDE